MLHINKNYKRVISPKLQQSEEIEEPASVLLKKASSPTNKTFRIKNRANKFNRWCKNFIFMPNSTIDQKNLMKVSSFNEKPRMEHGPFSPNVIRKGMTKLIDFSSNKTIQNLQPLSPKLNYFQNIRMNLINKGKLQGCFNNTSRVVSPLESNRITKITSPDNTYHPKVNLRTRNAQGCLRVKKSKIQSGCSRNNRGLKDSLLFCSL
ncbi:unnamed protein product [Moneuplotes crassus]|uniref:Uncharacterized protein n=1 Tax=Euplotes crassus TaxID=5936 RepID=A0AAD1U6Y5_EUPCR|nr:unnamed protein product [Moneuplotes crassus]